KTARKAAMSASGRIASHIHTSAFAPASQVARSRRLCLAQASNLTFCVARHRSRGDCAGSAEICLTSSHVKTGCANAGNANAPKSITLRKERLSSVHMSVPFFPGDPLPRRVPPQARPRPEHSQVRRDATVPCPVLRPMSKERGGEKAAPNFKVAYCRQNVGGSCFNAKPLPGPFLPDIPNETKR